MSEKGILKKIDDIFNYCEEIDNHLPKEEQTGYEMLPDIFYIRKEVRNLQQKVEQLENIRKEAIEYVYKHIQEYDVDGTFTNLDEFDFIASPQTLLNILNKGDNNGRK